MKSVKNFPFAIILLLSLTLPPVSAKAAEAVNPVNYALEHGYLYSADDAEITRAEWAYTFDEWLNYLQPSLTALGYAPSHVEVAFEDTAGNAFYDSIAAIASRGLVDAGTLNYRPDSLLQRQEFCEFVTVFLREIGIGPEYAMDMDAFTSAYLDWGAILPEYEDDVASMITLGLVHSVGDGMFSPNGSITRSQVCTVLLRAEALITAEIRNLHSSGFGEAGQMQIARVNGTNISTTGFNIEVTVNDAAKAVNPHVIIAYTEDPALEATTDSILRGRFKLQSHRLTEMRRVNTETDQTTYSVKFTGKSQTSYCVYVLLKTDAGYSDIVSYRLTTY